MKSILFVDDDQAILDALHARLHPLKKKWKMAFVDSGGAAIAQMEQCAFDVIVTDLRMPTMNGAQLLQIVSARWPQTIRIVLSGYAEIAPSFRLIPLAHQYLTKPCKPSQLENVIERCLQLHGLLQQPNLRACIGRTRRLPSLPSVYAALQRIAADDKATLADVVKLVSADAALAARVLHIVNSAFFRLARRISNLEQAVSYLGMNTICSLAMSVEVFSTWSVESFTDLDFAGLQAHVHAVAAAASSLTLKTPLENEAMLAGLLHDIGYWVLAQECPDDLKKAMELAVVKGIALHEAETDVLGASHAEIGAYLLGLWGLPFGVVEAVAHHHSPGRIEHSEFDVLAALVIGQALTASDDSSVFGGRFRPDSKIDASYLTAVGAPFDWSGAVRLVAQRVESEQRSA